MLPLVPTDASGSPYWARADRAGSSELADATRDLPGRTRDGLLALLELYGDATVLDEAAKVLGDVPQMAAVLAQLKQLASQVQGARVSFDLADVPQTFQGQQKIYLVITDDKGNPISSKNPTKATVYAPSGPVEIMAQQLKDVEIVHTQRLSFNHKFDDRLKSGNYVVAIYCDKGLLGASSFKLA